MSVHYIKRLEEQQKNDEAMARFLARGGVIKTVPPPNCKTEQKRYSASLPMTKTMRELKTKVRPT